MNKSTGIEDQNTKSKPKTSPRVVALMLEEPWIQNRSLQDPPRKTLSRCEGWQSRAKLDRAQHQSLTVNVVNEADTKGTQDVHPSLSRQSPEAHSRKVHFKDKGLGINMGQAVHNILRQIQEDEIPSDEHGELVGEGLQKTISLKDLLELRRDPSKAMLGAKGDPRTTRDAAQ